MKRIFTLLFGLFILLINGQQKINENLKKELDEIMRLDQGYRMLFDSETSSEKKDEILKGLNIDKEEFKKKNWMLVIAQDSLNLQKVEAIISKHGYPGKTLVGEPTNKAAWYVIQHSNKIGKYLPLIKEAGKKNEISYKLIATMEDRYLMENGKEQLYGTQGSGAFWEENGKEYQTEYIWPIKDPQNVNKKRKEAGFPNTVEENAKDLYGENFVYKVYTLDDIKNKKVEVKEVKH